MDPASLGRGWLLDDVVLHVLEKADEYFALLNGELAVQDHHEHVDALLGEGIGKMASTAPT